MDGGARGSLAGGTTGRPTAQTRWRLRLDTLSSVLAFSLLLFFALAVLSRYLFRQSWNDALWFSAAFAGVRLLIDLFLLRKRRRE